MRTLRNKRKRVIIQTVQDLKFLNVLNSIPGIGPVTLRSLKNHFGSFETAWRAPETDLAASGIRKLELQTILWKRPSLHPDREMEKLIRGNIWLISEDDENFPAELHEIPQPPVVIYGRGNLQSIWRREPNTMIAVVGTRIPTHYGLEATEKIVHGLARAGVTIVSGLAMGIDTRAHEAAIDVKGKTIAVLGCGVDHDSVFPPENRGLVRRITEGEGAVISEYAPGTPATKDHFPARNRIISGLARGVLVVEAREKSGALITARLALEQNRDVFAVPGSIFTTTSAGPHRLIQQGAKLVMRAEDILEELGMNYTREEAARADGLFDEKEKALLELLEEPAGIDLIKEKTGWETAAIVASLSMLELHGRIRSLGGDTYQKSA